MATNYIINVWDRSENHQDSLILAPALLNIANKQGTGQIRIECLTQESLMPICTGEVKPYFSLKCLIRFKNDGSMCNLQCK